MAKGPKTDKKPARKPTGPNASNAMASSKPAVVAKSAPKSSKEILAAVGGGKKVFYALLYSYLPY